MKIRGLLLELCLNLLDCARVNQHPRPKQQINFSPSLTRQDCGTGSILGVCDVEPIAESVLFWWRCMQSHVKEVRRVAERADECCQEETFVYVLHTARRTMKWRKA